MSFIWQAIFLSIVFIIQFTYNNTTTGSSTSEYQPIFVFSLVIILYFFLYTIIYTININFVGSRLTGCMYVCMFMVGTFSCTKKMIAEGTTAWVCSIRCSKSTSSGNAEPHARYKWRHTHRGRNYDIYYIYLWLHGLPRRLLRVKPPIIIPVCCCCVVRVLSWRVKVMETKNTGKNYETKIAL